MLGFTGTGSAARAGWGLLLCLLLAAAAAGAAAQSVVSGGVALPPQIAVVAGAGGLNGTVPSATPEAATSAKIAPNAAAVDSAGNIYIADDNGAIGYDVIEEVKAATGQIVVIAGAAGSNYPSTTPQAATSVSLEGLFSIAVDSGGNIYIGSAFASGQIYEIFASGPDAGDLVLVAGNESDAKPTSLLSSAQSTRLSGLPFDLALDGAGNLYVGTYSSNALDKISLFSDPANDQIVLVASDAGTGGTLPTTSPEALTNAKIGYVFGVAVDSAGNVYVDDNSNNQIDKISGSHIALVAGGGSGGAPSATPAPATSVTLSNPGGVAVDREGNLFIADTGNEGNGEIEEVSARTGDIVSIAGLGSTAPSPAPENPASALLVAPAYPVLDAAGDLLITDTGQIEKLGTDATFPAVAIGSSPPSAALSIELTSATAISGITFAPAQNHAQEFAPSTGTGCVMDGSTMNPSGTICTIPVTFTPSLPGTRASTIDVYNGTTVIGTVGVFGTGVGPQLAQLPGATTVVAGGGSTAPGATAEPAASAQFTNPTHVAVDAAGTLYITDSKPGNGVIDKVSASEITAITSGLGLPQGIAVDAAGNLYIADEDQVEKMDGATGQVTVLAGGGSTVPGAKPILATNAWFSSLVGLAVDNAGNVYIVDAGANNRVEEVFAATGEITTIAGGGSTTPSTTPILATSAQLNAPAGVAVDAAGDVYISDQDNNLVEEVTPATGEIGDIHVIAGGGSGSPPSATPQTATSVSLNAPAGLALDGAGDLYIADSRDNLVAELSAATGEIVSIAGGGGTVPSSTPEAATSAQFSTPTGIALDGVGNLYIADRFNKLIETVSASAPTFAFAATDVGSTSASQALTLANTGNQALMLNSLSATADFPVQSGGTCTVGPSTAQDLAAGASCTALYASLPTTSGALSESATLTDNTLGASNAQQSVSFSGTGNGPLAGLSPTTLPFTTAELVGQTTAAQSVTLSNTGNEPLSIVSIAASGDFSETNTCGTSVAANATCTISVSFSPTAAGARTGTLTVTDNSLNGADAQQTVSLSGTGTGPTAGLNEPSLSYGSEAVGGTTAAQTVTLSNTGNAALSIASIAASGDFSETNTCGTSVAASGNCTISVTFSPTASGGLTGTLTVTDNSLNATNAQQTVSLSGTGTSPTAGLSTGTLSFMAEAMNDTSAPQTVTLSNTGNEPLSIASIAASGDFAETNNCGTSVAANGTCTVLVTFTPSAGGNRSGTLTVVDNSLNVTNAQQTAALAGTGAEAAAGLSPSSLTFASQPVGTTTAAQTVTLTNTGSAALTISGISAVGDFAETNTCGTSVAINATCTISVTFTPAAAGARTGTVTITDNALDQTSVQQNVAISGTGAAPVAGLSPSSLTFATAQPVGQTATAQTVTLSNTGNTALAISAIAAAGDFAETNTCGASLAANANCAISVTFTPTASGARTGTLTVADNSQDATGAQQSVALSGTGAAPVAALSPSSLTFASQPVGTTAAAQTVTLSNTGNTALAISSIAAAGDFAETNTCGASLAANANCAISVTFSPTATGARTGALTVTDNSQGESSQQQDVPLAGSGSGTAPTASFSPSSLTFATPQPVGQTAAAQTVTLTNTGNASLTIAAIAATGDFAETNTCGASLAANANCSIAVTFTPTAAGARAGDLTLTDNAANSPQAVSLAGTGAAPIAGLSPSSLSFASQPVGTTAAAQTVTLSNSGNTALAISSIAATGDFTETNNCGSSLAASAACSIQVAFAPTATGSRTGTLTVTDNSQGQSSQQQSVSLAGTGSGTAPTAGLSPSSLTFATPQPVGATAAAQTVTLSNTGNASLTIAAIAATGDFAETNTCGASLAANANCSIAVTFTPTAAGARAGDITLTDNAANSPQAVSLAGTGAEPIAGLSLASLSFASQPVGTTAAAQTVTLSNTGNTALTIAGIAASGDFTETNNCGSSLAASAACSIQVAFAPTATGSRTGTLTVTDNSQGQSSQQQSVSLAGTGSGTAPTASLSPAALTFAAQPVGVASTAQTVTLSNTGNAALTIAAIAASGDFSETNNCGASLAANATCSIQVTFTPTAAGARAGTLTFTDNAANSPQAVSLAGAGAEPVAAIAPSSLTFASQPVGTTAAAQTVTLSNTGNAALTIAGIAATGDFSETNTCGASLAANAACSIQVAFTPTSTGNRTGTLTITDNSQDQSNQQQGVSLAGTGSGTAPTASLSPSSLAFASQPVNTTSAAQTVTLSNTGNASLTIAGIAASGDFSETNTCGSSLAANANCSISVTFTPTASGARAGTLTFTDNAANSPQAVSLAGTGSSPAPTASLSPAALNFATQPVNTTSAAQTVTLSNTGNATLTIAAIAASGDFSETNNCGTSLAVNATCSIQVAFAPAAAGALTGALMVTDNAAGSPQSVSLAGTGAGSLPAAALSPAALDFSGEIAGSTSAAQTVTLSNPGGAALTIATIAASGDFAETNNCGAALAAGATCAIQVTFTPASAGDLAGTLTVTDDASPGTQTAALSGSGEDITIAPAGGSSSSATTTPGGSANYSLSFTPVDGFSGTVAVSCAPQPPNPTITCSANPASLSLTGTSAQTVTVTVTTTASGAVVPWFNGRRWIWMLMLALGALLLVLLTGLLPGNAPRRARVRRWAVLGLALGSLVLLPACGGINNLVNHGNGGTSTSGTSAGTYTVAVTAAAANGSRTTQLTLTVH